MGIPHRCDVAILGAGLAGGLIALALGRRRPDLSILLVDASDRIGGHHIWSFFERDIPPANRWLLAPLVCHSWSGYDVAFPAYRRTLGSAYHSIRSERLDAAVREILPPESLLLGRRVHAAGPRGVLLDDGSEIEAGAVIDTRGVSDLTRLQLGWQKFVGHELLLAEPHGLDRPIVMDANLEQIDGYRFLYVLPFGPDRLFLEDTYYSDRPNLVAGTIGPRIGHYAAVRGWRVREVVREEQGVLPVAMGGDFEAYWRSGGDGIAKAGMRAGQFHPLTGYSLPDAVRTAVLVATVPDHDGEALHDLLFEDARRTWKDRSFYRMLSRMLFRAAMPPERWKVFEQFYQRDQRLIERFYAGRSTALDKLNILSGRPPVPLGRAMKAIIKGR